MIHVGQGVNLLLTHWLWSLQSLRSLRTVHWVVATEPGEQVPYTLELHRETPNGMLLDARQVPDKPIGSVDEAEQFKAVCRHFLRDLHVHRTALDALRGPCPISHSPRGGWGSNGVTLFYPVCCKSATVVTVAGMAWWPGTPYRLHLRLPVRGVVAKSVPADEQFQLWSRLAPAEFVDLEHG